MKYLHPIYGEVTIVTQFSSHVNVQTDHGLQAVQMRDLVLLETATTPKPAKAEKPSKPVATAKPVEKKPAPPPPEEDDNLVSVNASYTALHMGVKGIGRSRANRIVERRPVDGYTSLDEFREINKDLFEDEAAWQSVLKMVKV